MVPLDEHYQLNTGLKEHLYADAKQSDVSYLRLPGTFNHKTSDPVPVVMVRGTGAPVSDDDLDRLRTRAVRRASVAVDWVPVPVPTKGRISRRAKTNPEVAQHQDRSKEVWAIIGDLIKWGCLKDEIHTLLDDAPMVAAIQADRSYDIQKGIEKRWAEEATDDDGEAIEELTPEEEADDEREQFENLVREETLRLRAREEARRRVAEERAAAEFREPDRESYGTLVSQRLPR
ncbi:hypothetical protein OG559_09570 [Micromonospora sp. NBC_01405]|uniref:hypothetical protein n=1 Tax=Micromonospora sp. NBC_01405 TaxID=2903589 RepID=UPI003248A9C3